LSRTLHPNLLPRTPRYRHPHCQQLCPTQTTDSHRKKQLQKRHIALIFHNCKPHPPLLNCCRKIADANLGLHILWITDEPLEAPLRSFPPSQDNLLGAMQSWISEMIE